MKPIYAVLLCAVLLVMSRPALVSADELDDLLSSEPSALPPAQGQSDVGSESSADFDLADHEATSYSDQSRWHSAIGPSTARSTKSKPTLDASAQKPSEPSGLSVVPEPSAVFLAALALLYFLVFGRRRQVG